MAGTVQVTPADAGCYVDGHWGQYGTARVIEIAAELGYSDRDALEYARRHLASMGPSTDPGLADDEYDAMIGYADDAESWLNDHVAPAGHSFGWSDGEFFLQSADWWDQD